MIWTEKMFLYVFDRICKKHRPWECSKCPLSKWKGGCNFGLMMSAMKDWAEKNIDKRILEGKNGE